MGLVLHHWSMVVRGLLMALLVGLVVAPSFGVINIALSADRVSPMFGDTVTITILRRARLRAFTHLV